MSILQLTALPLVASLLFATAALTPARATEPARDEALAYAVGVQTYIAGFPMMDLYRTLWETSFDPGRGHDRTLNEFFVFDRLITSKDDWVVTPNEDTVYSRAFLDLRAEPIILVIPPMGDRQYWVPLSDMRHDFDANLSWDTLGARGGAFALAAPGWQGVLPEGVQRIDMGTPIIWTLIRIAVDGAADLPAAVELQKQLRLVPLSQWGAARVTRPKPRPAHFPRFTRAELTDARAYFTTLNTVLRLAPRIGNPMDEAMAGWLREIGMDPANGFDWDKLTPATQRGLERATADAHRIITERMPRAVPIANNWQLARLAMRKSGDPVIAAAAAMLGLLWNPAEISTYDIAFFDGAGAPLDGRNRNVLRFAPPPPVDGFWSVSMYSAETQLFVPNPIDRYSFGDRTPGIVYGADGSLEIFLQHEAPTDPVERANWLPAPAGPFYLVTRHYSPRAAILTGDWLPPAVTNADPQGARPLETTNPLDIASVRAPAAAMPLAAAQDWPPAEQLNTRSGIIELESNGYPTDATVRRMEEEIDYQRAVQAYIHYIPAVGMMQLRNAHFGPLGGKAGDMIVYRTTEQKLPILTPNDTTTYIITWAELSETGGLLMYEVPPGPTGGGILDVWQRSLSDTGMVGPDRGKGGKFLIVLQGTEIPANHGADFVITSKTDTVFIGTRILTPDPREGQRILDAHRIHGLGQESKIRNFEAPNRDWWNYQPRGLEYWEVVHQAIQLNPIEERDMAVLQGLKNLGIEKGKPFAPTDAQQKILLEAALVGETWAMGNSFLKANPVKHWTDDPKSQWQYILFMQSPLDQMAKTHMEIDARAAYTYEAITVSEANTQVLVDAGMQYLAAYKDDAGQWLDGAKTYELVVPPDVPMLNFWSVVLYDNDSRGMIINPQAKTEVNSRQPLVKNKDGSVRLVFSPKKPDGVPEANWIQTNPEKGFFAYFRWYSPTQAFFDRSWKMGNIRRN